MELFIDFFRLSFPNTFKEILTEKLKCEYLYGVFGIFSFIENLNVSRCMLIKPNKV